MANVQKFAEFSPEIPFSEFNLYNLFAQSFEDSELGRMKRMLPLHEMAESLGLFDKVKHNSSGRKSYFTPEGKVALMFLRMYTQLSFPKLMEQLNSNIHFQMFCGVIIDPLAPLTNYRLLDAIALELSGKLKIKELQKVLADKWKPYMKDLDTVYMDATCYQSEMRYPTDPKLVWECVEKSYQMMCGMCRQIRVKRVRTKYNDVSKAYLTYAKKRKRKEKERRQILRRELDLLDKMIREIRKMELDNPGSKLLNERQKRLMETIGTVYRQQKDHLESGNKHESIPDRIVSIAKPHVRPIVRGKESNPVEFGAKCNNIQVDGISFIDKLSFDAYNEGTRLEACIELHEMLFGTKVKRLAGDTSYAGSINRRLCKEKGIETSFVKRGKPSKEPTESDEIRKELARVRATSMEGSFGTQKEHYSMRKNKARLKETEILYIFFGIHTANVVEMSSRVIEKEKAVA